MTDNTRVNELQDKLLKAIDILNAQALNSISFDKTILCKIENDKDRKEGKYEVSDGNKIFVAYSTDTFLRKDEQVYVTIPEGKFENQKMIIGKKTAENDKPFIFQTPFDTFFDMTGNILGKNKKFTGQLIANALNKYDKNEEKEYENLLIYKYSQENNFNKALISNYTRLAIKADFKSWIKEAIRGDYGLLVNLIVEETNTVNKEKQESKIHSFIFNSSNMYGNPYSFETNYSQELVVSLDNVKGIINDIEIYFYQDHNFFDRFNEPILCSEKGYLTEQDTNRYLLDDQGNYQLKPNDILLSHNLFVDNIYLSFGYDISTFNKDYVEIYTQDRDSYRRSTEVDKDYKEENKKIINMRWVHLKDGVPVDMVAAIDKNPTETESEYEVRWYKYSIGAAAADAYSSVYWERLYIEKQENFYIMRNWTEEDNINNCEKQMFQNLVFNPDVNKQQEKIKAIVLYNGIPYYGNELIFTNEEELPPSKEAQHIMNALNIECDDNTNGNYMIYGQDNSIKDTEFGKITRTLSVYFDVNNDGKIDKDNEKVNDLKNIKWTFPAKNTMINLLNSDKKPVTVGEGDEQQIIAYTFNSEIDYPQYTINDHYSPSKDNNTIECEYSLNGVIYTTEKEFTFGPSGTMGTEQTLIIDFVGDRKAIDTTDNNCEIQVQLYNNQNQLITDLNNITWSWYYRSDENLYFNETDKNKQIINLIKSNDDIINGLYIIQVNVGDLETYFPIPIKTSGYNYISGPTQVIYQSNGSPLYNQDAYTLKPIANQDNIVWRIRIDRKGYVYEPVEQKDKKETDFNDGKYYQKNDNKYIWINPTTTHYDAQNNYYIKKEENEKCYINNSNAIIPFEKNLNFNENEEIKNYLPSLNNKKLKPLNIYVKEAPIYGVQALNNDKVVWTQPILVLQNKWPNGVINKWDGESLVLDEANSTIISAALSAGKKNSEDNTFSGVMIGDWEGQDVAEDITKQTGIYGFHHGAMSYAFKEDGTAFIGKSSMARINFNGSDATITSAGYEGNQGGMKINLWNNGNPYISLKSPGTSATNSIYSEMRLDTKNGGSTIYMKKANNQDITITNASETTPLKIGSNFNVDWDGNIDAQGGVIGDWKIVDKKLQSKTGNIILDATNAGSIILKKGTSKISGGILSSSTNDGRMQLQGYLEVGDGTLGYVASNSPAAENPDGIGLTYKVNNNSSHSRVIASNVNAALGFGNAYVSAEANNVGLGGGNNGTFGMCTQQATTIISNLGINKQGMDMGKDIFYCSVPASNQWGIYARFA